MDTTFRHVVLDPSGKVDYRQTGSTAKEWNAVVDLLAKATAR